MMTKKRRNTLAKRGIAVGMIVMSAFILMGEFLGGQAVAYTVLVITGGFIGGCIVVGALNQDDEDS